jgi:hypothetical protein
MPHLLGVHSCIAIFRWLYIFLHLGWRSIIPSLKVIAGPGRSHPINLTLMFLANADRTCLLNDPVYCSLMIISCDVKHIILVLFIIKVKFVTANQRFESHIYFKFIVWLLMLLLMVLRLLTGRLTAFIKQSRVRIVLLDHHWWIKNQPVRSWNLDRRG